jgi:hypothetical protein
MSTITAAIILDSLKTVTDERAARAATPGLSLKVNAIKAYQQRRFKQTYADLLSSARYGPAARFFLDELYGPSDFTRRDAQFARVVPALVRLFSHDIVATVATLAELHALSERLDTAMGSHLGGIEVRARDYVCAWQATGRPADRERQIVLTLDVAGQLDRFTRRPLLRNGLRLMRGPAQAAGLIDLQHFLERGFDTFKSMNGASEFVHTVATRERALVAKLFGIALAHPDCGSSPTEILDADLPP